MARVALIVICCAANFLYAIYLAGIGVVLPRIGQAFGFGPAIQGRLFPANFAGMIAGVLLSGMLSDRLGRKSVMLGSIAIGMLGVTLFGRATTFGLALLAAPLIGGGLGAMQCVAGALASDLFPHRRAVVLNTTQVAFGIGATISPFAIARMLAAGTDWRALYLGMAALLALLFAVLALQAVPRNAGANRNVHEDVGARSPRLPGLMSERQDIGARSPRPPHRSRPQDETGIFPDLSASTRRSAKLTLSSALLLLCVAQVCYAGAEVGYWAWMPSYFMARLPGGAAWAGGVVTLFWLVMTVGRAVTGALLHRFPLPHLLILMTASGAVWAELTLACPNPATALMCVALTALCLSGAFCVILAEAGNLFAGRAGIAFGSIAAAGGIGGGLFPWLIAVLAQTHGWTVGLLLVPMLACSVAAVGAILTRGVEIGVDEI